MIASALAASRNGESGLRPVNTRRDMVGLADLLAIAFAPTLDAAGRRMVRRMRQVGQAGWPGWVAGHFFLPPAAYPQGFVWLAEGKVVGNASMIEVAGSPGRWVIANVAVHPRYRRKGIASALMNACLDRASLERGREIVLQVDADNTGALSLYKDLGFTQTTARIIWTREGFPLDEKRDSAPMRKRRPEEWRAQWELAQRFMPEGLVWPYALKASFYQTSDLLEHFGIGGRRHWVWVENGNMKASLTARWGIDENRWRLVLVMDPELCGIAEAEVLQHGLAALQRGHAPVILDYPHAAGREALIKMHFRPRRTLVWMQRSL